MAKETAEQKLLKLIEATEAKDPSPVPAAASFSSPRAVPAAEARRTLESVQSLGLGGVPLPPVFSQLMDFIRSPAAGAQSLGIKQLNGALLVLILLIAVYFVSDFSRGMKASQREFNYDQVDAAAVSRGIAEMTGSLFARYRDLSEYAAIVSRRNIFQPFERKVEEAESEAVVVEPDQQVKEKISQFRLVGISWLDSPDTVTVMVEDPQTQVTHFLKKGDEFQGVRIEEIYSDSVEFSYNGQKSALRL